MDSNLFKKSSFILLCSIFFLSCLSIRPGAQKGGKNLYESFSSGNNSTTYFIKPFSFPGQNTKGSIDMDFTFRYTNISNDTADLKFSVFDDAVLKTVDSVHLESGKTFLSMPHVNHMFSEKTSRQYTNRFNAQVALSKLSNAFDDPNWKISIYIKGKANIYAASRKTKKGITKLKAYVFAVL